MTATTMQTLAAKPRQAAGKGAARRLRQEGLVPAIAYGKGLPATAIAVGPKEVAAILRSELGKNTLIELALEGKTLLAMIKDFSLHPLARSLEHIDFVEVKLDQPVDVEVPLVTTGKAVGVAKGGVLRIVHRTLPVRCLPNLVPIKISTDVAHLELGEHIATQDLKLPDGVVVRLPATQTLVAVVAPEKEVEEVVAPVAGAVAAAAGAAAPAAGAAAPAADAKKDDKKEEKKK